MDREYWQRIDALFEAALDQPSEDRTRFLDRQCGEDQDLGWEVEHRPPAQDVKIKTEIRAGGVPWIG